MSEFSKKMMRELDFVKLTEVQEKAMPVLEKGESLVALAPTGTGKTAAFVLPVVERVFKEFSNHKDRVVRVLILVPTREIGHQIFSLVSQVLLKIPESGIQVRKVLGGYKIDSQKSELKKNPEIVVGTPGRVLDLLEQEALNLSDLKICILDEADIMVGMGFGPQIKEVFTSFPKKHKIQYAFFSATATVKVNELFEEIAPGLRQIDVRGGGEVGETVGVCKHTYMVVDLYEKVRGLSSYLKNKGKDEKRVLVFCQTKEGAHTLADSLVELGFQAAALSGNLGQVERDTILRRFKNGSVRILVATNVAARGIDVKGMPLVVHFDLPSTTEEYVHRSGRTARAGETGCVVGLTTPKTEAFYLNLMNKLEIVAEKVDITLDKESDLVEKKAGFDVVYLNKGKKDKLRPSDVLGALIKDIGLSKEEVGGIFIFNHFTQVEIMENKVKVVLNNLKTLKSKAIRPSLKNPVI